MSLYELGIIGDATPNERVRLTQTLVEMVSPFGLNFGRDILLRDAAGLNERDIRAATAVAYFGSAAQLDVGQAQILARASVPIIPTISGLVEFGAAIPAFLQSLNGLRRRSDDASMIELAAAMLECVGLLRRQRRVFVSYRRVESRSAALQLHDLLSERGFDVFLDTHDIRPGDSFQDVLWHRLCDSDVMVMLDTPTYFDNKWTRRELGRALAKEIHILRVVWPEHTPSRPTDLAETIYLDPAELEGTDGPIVDTAADQIIYAVENLRSRSIASRYMSITGKLRAGVEQIGARIEGIGANRAVAVRLLDGRRIWAYPVVGVPTAETLNDVVNRARRADQSERPILVYDHVGIQEAWSAHLKWLDENIKAVRAIKVSEAAWELAAWEE